MEEDLQRSSLGMPNDGENEILRQFMLKNHLEQTMNSRRTEALFKDGLGMIYFASKCRILRVADKLYGSFISGEPTLVEPMSEIALPEVEKWDFKLGDKVRIKYSMEEFQSIQDRTFGWLGKLRLVHGLDGIVIGISSAYGNVLDVHFPDLHSGFSLYAGLFEKVEQNYFEESRWKADDLVKTQTDINLIEALQHRREDIPYKFVGEKGRVIGVTKRSVHVTFDERNALQIHSSLLYPSDDKSPIEVCQTIHTHGFTVGEKVKVSSNLKSLVKTQMGLGGWHPSMVRLMGKTVTIVRLLEDGSVLVQLKHDRPWRVSAGAIIKLDETENVGGQDLDFLPGDVIKLNTPRDIAGILMGNNIPLEFMEYLKLTAVVKSVDGDLDFIIQFFKQQAFSVNKSIIAKAPSSETEKHKEIKEKLESLKPGDTVYLDVGPAKYVRALLTAEKADPDVITAMTESSVLLGFINYKTAVIKYKNGHKYKINKKYLTVPERFQIENSDELTNLLDMIQRFSV